MGEAEMPALQWEGLRPFVTLVVLRCVAEEEERAAAFAELEAYLATPGRRQSGRVVDLVAMSRSTTDTAAELAAQYGVDQLGGFVRRSEQPPSWAGLDGAFRDVAHDLTVALRVGDLVAVRAEGSVEERLQRRLNTEPRLRFRRLEPVVLENALLQGQAKNLWLRGTHRRSSLRPDVKTYGGRKLEEAVNSWEDSSFAMGSAKAELIDDPDRVLLRGVVGTTPRKSSVWFKRSADFHEFVTAVRELLALLQQELATGDSEPRVLQVLARQVSDLSGVSGAYDVAAIDPELLAGPVADEVYEAADVLEEATMIVHGSAGADFKLEVGLNGSTGGKLAATVNDHKGGFSLKIGHDPLAVPTDVDAVTQVCAALQYPQLLSVYYRSGHAYVNGEMWKTRIPTDPFPRWEFVDFQDHLIKQEKPASKTAQEIHEKVGKGGKSLFDWVVQRYSEGCLTCDDGPNEVADFLHVAWSGELTAIHVKGAESDSMRRGVSATAYEVVTSQAEKNMLWFADLQGLRKRLERPQVAKPATWIDGVKGDDRGEFLDAFESRSTSDELHVVIVQPHVSEATYNRLRTEPLPAQPSNELMRLFRLETLLRMARIAAVGVNAELTVVSSKT